MEKRSVNKISCQSLWEAIFTFIGAQSSVVKRETQIIKDNDCLTLSYFTPHDAPPKWIYIYIYIYIYLDNIGWFNRLNNYLVIYIYI